MNAAGNKHILDPLNLIFFVKNVVETDEFFDIDIKLVTVLVKFFEMTLGYALVFKTDADHFISLDLLRLAK